MTFKLRNDRYNFGSNIMDMDDPEMFFYENEICDILNKQKDELKLYKHDVEFVDRMNIMQERRLQRQAKHLQKIYKMIEKKDWMGLEALYMDTHQDYEEIV